MVRIANDLLDPREGDMTDTATSSSTAPDAASNAGSGASQAICNCPICRAARAAAASGQSLSDYLSQFYASLLAPVSDLSQQQYNDREHH